MNSRKLLPEGFEALEPFLEAWAIDGANNRHLARLDSAENDRVAFFNAGSELVPAALELLDRKPLDRFDEKEERLMKLVLSMAHVAPAVEVQKDAESIHAKYARHITITRAPADDPVVPTRPA